MNSIHHFVDGLLAAESKEETDAIMARVYKAADAFSEEQRQQICDALQQRMDEWQRQHDEMKRYYDAKFDGNGNVRPEWKEPKVG